MENGEFLDEILHRLIGGVDAEVLAGLAEDDAGNEELHLGAFLGVATGGEGLDEAHDFETIRIEALQIRGEAQRGGAEIDEFGLRVGAAIDRDAASSGGGIAEEALGIHEDEAQEEDDDHDDDEAGVFADVLDHAGWCAVARGRRVKAGRWEASTLM